MLFSNETPSSYLVRPYVLLRLNIRECLILIEATLPTSSDYFSVRHPSVITVLNAPHIGSVTCFPQSKVDTYSLTVSAGMLGGNSLRPLLLQSTVLLLSNNNNNIAIWSTTPATTTLCSSITLLEHRRYNNTIESQNNNHNFGRKHKKKLDGDDFSISVLLRTSALADISVCRWVAFSVFFRIL